MALRQGLHGVWALGALTLAISALAGLNSDARAAGPVFSKGSPWNVPPPASAPIDRDSSAMIDGLLTEVTAEQLGRRGPWINTNAWSVPVYTVPKRQRTTKVILDHAPDPALSRAFRRVPLPRGAHPAAGTDHHLVVWQPATDRMWEFFGLVRSHGRWRTNWGGAMRRVSRNLGVFGPAAWPGAKPWWGASATSLPLLGGLMRVGELESGRIDHALAIALPNPRAGVWAWPAQRSDGNGSGPAAIPEGARLRIDPRLDLSQLPMPPLTRMMAAAAQRYGIIVRDRAGVITFAAEDPTPLGVVNPYTNNALSGQPLPGGLFDGRWPATLLSSFPWSHLQVLKMSLHRARS
jgi:hypothetical protein